MAAIGGPVRAVSIAGRRFPVAADADGSRKIGGRENEVQMNGNGSARYVQTAVAWMIGGLTLSIDDDRADQEFLQDLADNAGDKACTFDFANGTTWGGQGNISGELSFSTQNSTASVEFSGPGKLEQQ